LDLPQQQAAGNTTFQCGDHSQKIRTSDPPVRSIADLAESLMWEFEPVLPIAVVTEVIMRLSRNGTVSLDILGNLARRDLAAMAAERCKHDDLIAAPRSLGHGCDFAGHGTQL
jgi:hypothetical protein